MRTLAGRCAGPGRAHERVHRRRNHCARNCLGGHFVPAEACRL